MRNGRSVLLRKEQDEGKTRISRHFPSREKSRYNRLDRAHLQMKIRVRQRRVKDLYGFSLRHPRDYHTEWMSHHQLRYSA